MARESAGSLPESSSLWLHRFAVFTAFSTLFLIFAGGLVTSTESGLAVPDWPLSYGMFFPPMVGGIFYEHGHRMVAAFVGLLTFTLTIWVFLKERRIWLRRLTLVALGAVILQAILGGLTVLYLLPTPISIAHAALAQTFFCMTVALALFTSPNWTRSVPLPRNYKRSPSLSWLCALTTGMVYSQLMLGALMRHTKAGLAIPDFPLAFGRIIPRFDSSAILIHFAHRVGAIMVTMMVVWTVYRIISTYRSQTRLLRPAIILAFLLVIQLMLGAMTIWSGKAIMITTFHVVTGAAILGTSFLLTLFAFVMTSSQFQTYIHPANKAV